MDLSEYLLLDDGIYALASAKSDEGTGALISANELLEAATTTKPIVKALLAGIVTDAVVLRAYWNSKQNCVAIQGDRLARFGDEPLVMGCRIPDAFSISWSSKDAGQEKKYRKPVATLNVPGKIKGELMAIELAVQSDVASDEYFDWCAKVCAAIESGDSKIPFLGEYKVPTLLKLRINLIDLPIGIYQILGHESFLKTSARTGNEYTTHSYTLMVNGESATTWDKVPPRSLQCRDLDRQLKMGKPMYLVNYGATAAVDKDGNQKFYQGTPEMEIMGTITPKPPSLDSVMLKGRSIQVLPPAASGISETYIYEYAEPFESAQPIKSAAPSFDDIPF